MGDAAHTAHYSIGSGTKLALEDAIELARCCAVHGAEGMDKVLAVYQDVRSVEVLKIQSAARNSMEWFENVDRYTQFEAPQFAYSMLTRSQRIPHENLRLRDAGYVEGYENWVAAHAFAQAGVPVPSASRPIPPMLTPFRARGVVLKNRIVVSPMAQYSAKDGVPGDFHLVHLGARAMGGAGMVCAEMTCVSPDARITPGCPGLWNDAQRDAWRRIVDFRPRGDRREDRDAAGSRRREGLDVRAVGGGGEDQPLAHGQLAARVRQRAAISRRHFADGARGDARRHGADQGRFRGRDPPRGGGRLRLARAPLRARLSAVVFHLAAHQPPRRRVRRRSRRPLPISARSVRGDPRRVARGQADQRAHLGARLGGRRHHAGRRGGDRPAVQGRGGGHDGLLVGPGRSRREAGLRADVPDAVRRPDHGTRRASPRSPWARYSRPITRTESSPPAAPTSARLRARISRIPRGRLPKRRSSAIRTSPWPKQYLSAKAQLERNLQREKEAAAANAGLTPQQIAASSSTAERACPVRAGGDSDQPKGRRMEFLQPANWPRPERLRERCRGEGKDDFRERNDRLGRARRVPCAGFRGPGAPGAREHRRGARRGGRAVPSTSSG